MNRRTLLAGTSSILSVPVVGCLASPPSELGNENDDTATSATGTPPESGNDCGPAHQPLSALLSDETGDPSACYDGAAPSLAIMNERETDLTVSVALRDGAALSETYTLGPGERTVETRAFEATPNLTGTVEIDGEETQVVWPDRSCYRHGIALLSKGIETGLVEPLSGPGDASHDCYAGDDAILSVVSRGEARSISVTVSDLCTGAETTEIFELGADDIERTRGLVKNGGRYDLTAVVEGGDSRTYAYRENCWGVAFSVEEDGELRVTQVGID